MRTTHRPKEKHGHHDEDEDDDENHDPVDTEDDGAIRVLHVYRHTPSNELSEEEVLP
jgi:hypothetical protein